MQEQYNVDDDEYILVIMNIIIPINIINNDKNKKSEKDKVV